MAREYANSLKNSSALGSFPIFLVLWILLLYPLSGVQILRHSRVILDLPIGGNPSTGIHNGGICYFQNDNVTALFVHD